MKNVIAHKKPLLTITGHNSDQNLDCSFFLFIHTVFKIFLTILGCNFAVNITRV
jgi:hypothetical protein